MSKIYQKLQEIRDEIAAADIKRTGHNAAGDFFYYEQSDFMPKAIELFKKYKIFDHVSFDKELATLALIDLESDSLIRFTAPMSTAADKKLHPVQNQGWAQTYLKRRLYINALGLIEQDPLDGGASSPSKSRGTVTERLADVEPELKGEEEAGEVSA